MKLAGMLDSPYVRRTAISMAFYDVEFSHLPLSVFSTFVEFSQINPVVKAPTLVLENNERLMDSTLILQWLEAQADVAHRLMPQSPVALAQDLQLIGLALAASEKTVQHVYEHHLRPQEKWHQPWIDRVTEQLLAACGEWDKALSARHASAKIDQVAITSAVVWSFIQLMIPEVIAAKNYPHLQQMAEKMEALPQFKKYPMN